MESTTTLASMVSEGHSNDDLLIRIRELSKMLQKSMQELGFDKAIGRTVETIPDAKDRLSYIARMTEEAANATLTASDEAKPLQDSIKAHSVRIGELVNQLGDPKNVDISPDEIKADIHAALSAIATDSTTTQKLLMDIVIAQGFQDLTGQVINKMNNIVHEIEVQFKEILTTNESESFEESVILRLSDGKAQTALPESEFLKNGPQIKKSKDDGAVSGQGEVDDLLSDLGF